MKVGDLVALPRRRNKGMGIILRYKESSERLNLHFKSLSSPSDYWSGSRNDNGMFLGESVEFADAFFLFNNWTNHPPRIKTKFVYIKWFLRTDCFLGSSGHRKSIFYKIRSIALLIYYVLFF